MECGSPLPLSYDGVGRSWGAHPPRVPFDVPRGKRWYGLVGRIVGCV
ncbi:MAG: hypothetical protein BWX84_01970 [Verrucomicrobia bacterium ADurb.Bin118]|nr:MAG: hypothetical protein BWX84_01970 [Verrucomicrobia bacterium ADurb.Bin118]